MKKYIAVGSVGHFGVGDVVEGLDADRIQALLDCGTIKELMPVIEIDDEPNPELEALEKQVADLKGDKEKLSTEKALSEEQVEILKAEITALKKAVVDAEKKTKATEK